MGNESSALDSFEKYIAIALNNMSERINPYETERAAKKIRGMMGSVLSTHSSPEDVEEWEDYGFGTVLKDLMGYYVERTVDTHRNFHRDTVGYTPNDKEADNYYLYLIMNCKSSESENQEHNIIVQRLEYNLDTPHGFCKYEGETHCNAEELIKKLRKDHPVTQFYNEIIQEE